VPLAVFPEDRCGPGSLGLVLAALGDAVPPAELARLLPDTAGRGVLSVDMLLAARARGFDAALVAGTGDTLARELRVGRPAILMLRLFDAPGSRRDVYHYVVADGIDGERGLFRLQFGDGKARWAELARIDGAWKPAGRALIVVRQRDATDAALRRAVELEEARRLEEAEALYREVLELRPESVRAWVDLGNVLSDRGRAPEAEAAYRRALALDPGDADALNNLAWLLHETGSRPDEAEALALQAAQKEGPRRYRAQDTLGRIQLARGRCADAARTFGDALASDSLPDATREGLKQALARATACRDALSPRR
jgi:Tfp pilus assembly protein PilF